MTIYHKNKNSKSIIDIYGEEIAEKFIIQAAPIRARRLIKKLSLRKLAPIVGVSRQAIELYEHGYMIPNDDVWKKLKATLELKGDKKDYFYLEHRKNSPPGYWKGRKCQVEFCNQEANGSKGFCQTHYVQQRKGKEFTPVKRVRRKNPENRGSCNFPDCGRKSRLIRGYCQSHYVQLRKGQKLRPLRRIAKRCCGRYPKDAVCKVPGCDRKPKSLGFCLKHYQQHRTGRISVGTL